VEKLDAETAAVKKMEAELPLVRRQLGASHPRVIARREELQNRAKKLIGDIEVAIRELQAADRQLEKTYKTGHPQRRIILKKIDELQKILSEGILESAWRKAGFTNSLGMRFVFIPPGEFTMGSPLSEAKRETDEIPHRVRITKGFYMSATEVTQGQWREVMGENPSRFKGDKHPVERVSWFDAMEFTRRLSRLEGKSYRLPTEAEWEYSCRAGTKTPFYTGGTITTDQANFNGNYTYGGSDPGVFREKTMPVAGFPPNPWGLFDMHGNVWEWCMDRHGRYSIKTATDPEGPEKGNKWIVRGGSWYVEPRICRSANRAGILPTETTDIVGFRIVAEEK
jgi:formylglycine-generating enzyme required for sulfatase activity